MELKDWVQLFVPIIANGLLLFIVQQLLSKRIDGIEKRQSLRDTIVLEFWNKIQRFRNSLADANRGIRIHPDEAHVYLEKCNQLFHETDQYYHINEFDLSIVKTEYLNFQHAWAVFANLIIAVANSSLTLEQRTELGNRVNHVYETATELSDAVRKKY